VKHTHASVVTRLCHSARFLSTPSLRGLCGAQAVVEIESPAMNTEASVDFQLPEISHGTWYSMAMLDIVVNGWWLEDKRIYVTFRIGFHAIFSLAWKDPPSTLPHQDSGSTKATRQQRDLVNYRPQRNASHAISLVKAMNTGDGHGDVAGQHITADFTRESLRRSRSDIRLSSGYNFQRHNIENHASSTDPWRPCPSIKPRASPSFSLNPLLRDNLSARLDNGNPTLSTTPRAPSQYPHRGSRHMWSRNCSYAHEM